MQLSRGQWAVLGASAGLLAFTGLLLVSLTAPSIPGAERRNGVWTVNITTGTTDAFESYYRPVFTGSQYTAYWETPWHNLSNRDMVQIGCERETAQFLKRYMHHHGHTSPATLAINHTTITVTTTDTITLPDRVHCIAHVNTASTTITIHINRKQAQQTFYNPATLQTLSDTTTCSNRPDTAHVALTSSGDQLHVNGTVITPWGTTTANFNSTTTVTGDTLRIHIQTHYTGGGNASRCLQRTINSSGDTEYTGGDWRGRYNATFSGVHQLNIQAIKIYHDSRPVTTVEVPANNSGP